MASPSATLAGRLAQPTPEPPRLPLAARLAVAVFAIIIAWIAASVAGTLIVKGL